MQAVQSFPTALPQQKHQVALQQQFFLARPLTVLPAVSAVP